MLNKTAVPWEEAGQCRLRVWGVEPYGGGSHEAFLRGLAAHSEHQFSLLTMPGRNWKWRMQGGAITLAAEGRKLLGALGENEPWGEKGRRETPNVIFASDMLNLPVFLALVPLPAAVPVILYFHENQLTYPLPVGVERDLTYGMMNIASALAARVVLFNSSYHRQEFLEAVEQLLVRMPDGVPAGVVRELEAKSLVLPVGCDLRGLDAFLPRARMDEAAGRWGDVGQGPLIVWNQRWEYDKAPEALVAALLDLRGQGMPFRVAVTGRGCEGSGAVLTQAKEALGEAVVHWGWLPRREDYASLLWAADVVVSTAVHEFFGVAVVEALYCGCRPVLPHCLSYPEIVPAEAHADVLYPEGDLVPALRRALVQPHEWSADWQRTWVARFDWGSLRQRYDNVIRRCWAGAQEEKKWRG